MFDGLDEGKMFVPQSSMKRLVLRNKENGEMSSTSMLSNTIGDDPAQETSLTVPLGKEMFAGRPKECNVNTGVSLGEGRRGNILSFERRAEIAPYNTSLKTPQELPFCF